MDKKLLIAEPIASELEIFNSQFRDSVFSDNDRIQKIIDRVMMSDGKRIRPILLLLSAKAFGKINETTYLAAITVELLHTATLIHDDVVDESLLRRGKPSINAIYDNKIAVLAGDYFLSTALIKSVLTSNIEIVSLISGLGRNLAEGELNQLSLAKEVIIDEDQYFEVIKMKTASLLSICMKIGALSVDAERENVDKFAELGEYLGICFQIKDDIFDYYSNNVGKPTGNDIREGKVTLPLLYALKNSDDKVTVSRMLAIINSADFTDENIHTLIDFAIDSEGINYAYSKIELYKHKASIIIDSLTDSDVKDALKLALDYVIDRVY